MERLAPREKIASAGRWIRKCQLSSLGGFLRGLKNAKTSAVRFHRKIRNLSSFSRDLDKRHTCRIEIATFDVEKLKRLAGHRTGIVCPSSTDRGLRARIHCHGGLGAKRCFPGPGK